MNPEAANATPAVIAAAARIKLPPLRFLGGLGSANPEVGGGNSGRFSSGGHGVTRPHFGQAASPANPAGTPKALRQWRQVIRFMV